MNESIMIGDDIEITVVAIRGDKTRIGIDAPKGIPVHRREIHDVIKRDKPSEVVESTDLSNTWLIWSNEHEAWWKPNDIGYTRDVFQAGRYGMDKAISICKGASHPDNDWTSNKSNHTAPNEVMVPSPEMLAARA